MQTRRLLADCLFCCTPDEKWHPQLHFLEQKSKICIRLSDSSHVRLPPIKCRPKSNESYSKREIETWNFGKLQSTGLQQTEGRGGERGKRGKGGAVGIQFHTLILAKKLVWSSYLISHDTTTIKRRRIILFRWQPPSVQPWLLLVCPDTTTFKLWQVDLEFFKNCFRLWN